MKIAAAIAVSCLAGLATADVVSYDADFSLARTNWSNSMVLPKFDSALGVLDKVSWAISGRVEGAASFESLDSEPTTVVTQLKARITLSRPDNSPLQVLLPIVSNSDAAGAFDGSIDFAGTSGKAYTGLSAGAAGSSFSTAPTDLATFTANSLGETISLPVTAIGDSFGSGAGNLVLLFQTFAASHVEVSYEYHQVPAPAAAGVLGLGGLATCSHRRRR